MQIASVSYCRCSRNLRDNTSSWWPTWATTIHSYHPVPIKLATQSAAHPTHTHSCVCQCNTIELNNKTKKYIIFHQLWLGGQIDEHNTHMNSIYIESRQIHILCANLSWEYYFFFTLAHARHRLIRPDVYEKGLKRYISGVKCSVWCHFSGKVTRTKTEQIEQRDQWNTIAQCNAMQCVPLQCNKLSLYTASSDGCWSKWKAT